MTKARDPRQLGLAAVYLVALVGTVGLVWGSTLLGSPTHHLSSASSSPSSNLASANAAAAAGNSPASLSSQRRVSSYSTLIAGKRVIDGALFLWSVALAQPRARVYVATDKRSYEWYRLNVPQLFDRLDLRWTFSVDKYNLTMSREEMIKAKVWADFQMEKAYVIEAALIENPDTVYMDADTILASPVMVPTAPEIQLGVSPHYMKPEAGTKWGVYNGGMLWTNQYSVGEAWVKATKKSRFFDQAAIEDLVGEYVTFEFGEETNLGWWRSMHGVGGMPEFRKHLYLDADGFLAYKNKTVSSIHAHFISEHCCSKAFVDVITQTIVSSPRYRNLISLLWWAKRDFTQPAPAFEDL